MFTFCDALVSMINGDPAATPAETPAEKSQAVALIRGVVVERGIASGARVIRIKDAATMLGHRTTYPVRKAVADGLLKPYYGGVDCKRMTGVMADSFEAFLKRSGK